MFSQGNIPSVTAEKVKEMILAGVEDALGLPTSSLEIPIYSRIQLWYQFSPVNNDPLGRAAFCGD